jgi:soluble lytic murein transglycosylase-like protein
VRPGLVCVVSLFLLALPQVARAELYSFVDTDGVLHFTNIPDDPRYEPVRAEGLRNTFNWQDNLGTLRKVHRVEIKDYDDLIVEAARYYSLPPALLKAMTAVESSFEPAAVSPAGAQGLLQLMPVTARAMQVADPFDARQNIYGGARYLRILANRFKGDVRLTVAGYNAGPDAVERAKGVPDFSETQTYVKRVLALYRHYLQTWPPGAR